MDEYTKMILVAFACLVVGIPLWTAIFSPEAFSTSMFSDTGFWIAVIAGVAMILSGFWVGQRAGFGK